ncbi:hypothetical protein [Lacisediminihabitans sp. H27-G8]|uniref:hypothetical protein n=1 Tax=Lacisediminihabitans sp. H27-G8 TaxID=3111909 RepID=UPI0038FCD465
MFISPTGSSFDTALTVDGLTEFSYRNTSEQPDGVTDQQWREREEYWERVTPTGALKATMTDLAIESPVLDSADPAVITQLLEVMPSSNR